MTMSCYAEIFLKRCSSMFLLPWFLWFFISILLQICFSVQCPWFILNFCFVLPSTVRYDSVTVLLRCKSLVSFLTHDVPQLDPVCKPLASCVPCVGLWWRHARVCRILWDASVSWVFWRPLAGALFTRQSRDWLTGMWHSCAPALGAKYTLELFL